MGTFNVECIRCGGVFQPSDDSELGKKASERAIAHPEKLDAMLINDCGCKEEDDRKSEAFYAFFE